MTTALLVCLAAVFCMTSLCAAESLIIGAGAGYKRLLEGVFKIYEQSSGQKVDQVYGHMGQVTMQAKTGGDIGIIVGEKAFLQSCGIEFAELRELGRGLLVLAYGKEIKLESLEDLTKPQVRKIAMPDAKQAIYGKAASELLQSSGLLGKIQDKLITVATVPQVSAYLISRDADAGFINITDAIYIKDQIGGWLEIDPNGYSPIHLVIGVVKGFEDRPEVKNLLGFVSANGEVAEMIQKAGIQ